MRDANEYYEMGWNDATGASMEKGQTFMRYGADWRATEVTIEKNQRFKWLKVAAVWSGVGPRPVWATEPRVFCMERCFISTGKLVIAD